MHINQYQRIMLDTYCGGEFAHIKSRSELGTCGDSLVEFLFEELEEDDLMTARSRMSIAMSQICAVHDALREPE